MDNSLLNPLIHRFLQSQDSDPIIREQMVQHARRSERAQQFLQVENVPQLTREQIQDLLQDTDAWFGLRWNKQEFWDHVFGSNDEKLPALRVMLLELVRKAEVGLTAQDFNAFTQMKTGLGRGYLSELLGLRFPNRYWLLNKQVYKFLQTQGIDLKAELPFGKKGDVGEEYFAVGRHLQDLRRVLGEAAGRPVDLLFTDLFLYWANQQQTPDPLLERIVQLLKQYVPAERVQARVDAEQRMRAFIENKLGQFTESDVRNLLAGIDVDWWKGKVKQGRFGMAFATPQANQMVQNLPAFNLWLERFWKTEDAALNGVLDEFWNRVPFGGAGIAFPSMMLYLRDSQRYNIWLPVLVQGLKNALGFAPGKRRVASSYREYNQTVCEFRDRYQIPPQGLDIILTILGKGKLELPPSEVEEEWSEQETIEVDDTVTARYALDRLMEDTFLDEIFWRKVETLLEQKAQLVLYGPPGTGKTWVARNFARYWAERAPDPRGKVEIVQFHPSYAYEEFVEGIRPESVAGADGRRELSYPVKPGLFLKMCQAAQANSEQRFVLILDEINRGELPRILGELLYALEYRDQKVRLPYSGNELVIPQNLYLLGTMNTADRSIALVDHALRRRFHFVDLRPDAEILRDYFEKHALTEMQWVADLLELVNRKLERDGIEWHLQIGHSHFMQSPLDEARVRLIWEHSILPTLEEYFYRQPDKLKAYSLDELNAELGSNA